MRRRWRDYVVYHRRLHLTPPNSHHVVTTTSLFHHHLNHDSSSYCSDLQVETLSQHFTRYHAKFITWTMGFSSPSVLYSYDISSSFSHLLPLSSLLHNVSFNFSLIFSFPFFFYSSTPRPADLSSFYGGAAVTSPPAGSARLFDLQLMQVVQHRRLHRKLCRSVLLIWLWPLGTSTDSTLTASIQIFVLTIAWQRSTSRVAIWGWDGPCMIQYES